MDLRNLRYFEAIANAGSFSAATAVLHRTQPALSRAIQDLEAELGFALFVREGRRIALTPEGRSVLEEARPVIEGACALEAHARLLASGKTSILRIGGATSTIERALPALIAGFRTTHPHVEITLATDSGSGLLAGLEQGELDAVFTRQTSSDLLESRRLFPLHVVAAIHAPHPLSGHPSLDVRQLGNEPLLLAPETFTSRILFDAACAQVGFRPRILFQNHDHNALVALASVGYGIAIVPSTVLLTAPNIHVVPVRNARGLMGLWTGLVIRRGTQRPHVLEFVDEAARRLGRVYPGKELNLPALPDGKFRGAAEYG
uniref:LysR family transcriptional regulator n=1 Tax=Cupriavidus necator TaxID=106590 RepID=UPI003F4979E9